MAKLLDEKIYAFLDELYGEEYLNFLTNDELYQLVNDIQGLLKPHLRTIQRLKEVMEVE